MSEIHAQVLPGNACAWRTHTYTQQTGRTGKRCFELFSFTFFGDFRNVCVRVYVCYDLGMCGALVFVLCRQKCLINPYLDGFVETF